MNPLDFRQESPPTRLGRRAVGGLILKAGMEMPPSPPGGSEGPKSKMVMPATPAPPAGGKGTGTTGSVFTPKKAAQVLKPPTTTGPAAGRGGLTGRFQGDVKSPHEGPASTIGPKPAVSTPSVRPTELAKPLVSPKGEEVTSRLTMPQAKPESTVSPPAHISRYAHGLSNELGVHTHGVSHADAADFHESVFQRTGDPQHKAAADAHRFTAQISQPSPPTTSGEKITPAAGVVGSSARTPAEHAAVQKVARPTPIFREPKGGPEVQPSGYGKPMTQAAPEGAQASLPHVAVHQQAMRGGAGHQLEMPGGAAMHTPGKEPAAKMPETIGQAEARAGQAETRRRQTFGSPTAAQREASHHLRTKELEPAAESGPMRAVPKGAAVAKPPETEGMPEKEAQAARAEWERKPKPGQALLPGMSTASGHAQRQAEQKLTKEYSREGRELGAARGQQMGLGGLVESERGPQTEAGRIGQTMREGSPEQRRAVLKEGAAALRGRAEAAGLQKPKAVEKPEFKPAGKGVDPHGNLAAYHRNMADHHEHLFNQTKEPKHLEAASAHRNAAESHSGVSKIAEAQRTPDHKSTAFSHSDRAERLSREAGVEGSLSSKVEPAKKKVAKQKTAGRGGPPHPKNFDNRSDYHNARAKYHENEFNRTGNKDHLRAAALHQQAAGGGAETATAGGGEEPPRSPGRGRTGRAAPAGPGNLAASDRAEQASARAEGRKKISPGVAGPQTGSLYAKWYGMGLAAGSLGGPMYQTAQLGQMGASAYQRAGATRKTYRQQAREDARDAHTAMVQRQQQLQQMYGMANKSLSATPLLLFGLRIVG